MRMGQVYRKQNKNKIKAQFSTNLILKDQIEKKTENYSSQHELACQTHSLSCETKINHIK
jgi:hypothetical protein